MDVVRDAADVIVLLAYLAVVGPNDVEAEADALAADELEAYETEADEPEAAAELVVA